MDYLVYVEHNAENLQFYLWYKDYVRRFNELPQEEKVLSPEWVPGVNEAPDLTQGAEKKTANFKRQTIAAMMETGYAGKGAEVFGEDKDTGNLRRTSAVKDTASFIGSTVSDSTTLTTAEVTAQAGLKWQPCTTISSITLPCCC
jgi:hypothetical protein